MLTFVEALHHGGPTDQRKGHILKSVSISPTHQSQSQQDIWIFPHLSVGIRIHLLMWFVATFRQDGR